ncbi:MAG: GatB/YqeY domain-containing protein [Pseudomonadota bacterium]
MRDEINAAVKAAMKAGEKSRLTTLRMITAAIKDRDIAARVDANGKQTGIEQVGDDEILQLLQKMIKQRRESIATYETAGRKDLVAQEQAEIGIIEAFLPKQMTEEEVKAAVAEAVAEIKPDGMKDMGKVMGVLKSRYTGRMDFAKASAAVKAAIS